MPTRIWNVPPEAASDSCSKEQLFRKGLQNSNGINYHGDLFKRMKNQGFFLQTFQNYFRNILEKLTKDSSLKHNPWVMFMKNVLANCETVSHFFNYNMKRTYHRWFIQKFHYNELCCRKLINSWRLQQLAYTNIYYKTKKVTKINLYQVKVYLKNLQLYYYSQLQDL